MSRPTPPGRGREAAGWLARGPAHGPCTSCLRSPRTARHDPARHAHLPTGRAARPGHRRQQGHRPGRRRGAGRQPAPRWCSPPAAWMRWRRRRPSSRRGRARARGRCSWTSPTAPRCARWSRRKAPSTSLLNNAGTNIRQPFLEVADASLDALLQLNVRRDVHRGAGGREGDGRGREGRRDHQPLLRQRPCRRRQPHRLHRDQARGGGHDQGDGLRDGPARHPRERHRARLRRDAADDAGAVRREVPRARRADRCRLAAS